MSEPVADLPIDIPVRIDGKQAWKGAEMRHRSEWLHHLTDSDVSEILDAVEHFRASGLALDQISPKTFSVPGLAAKLNVILDELLNGRGFVVIRGMPVQKLGKDGSAIAYLGLGSHLGSFRSQNAKGHLLGHVRDIGGDITKPTTRYYQTNKELEYHTDSCDIVGLLCLSTAKSGGESRIVSSVSIYNRLMETRPDLAEQLFHAFPTDRRGEIPPGMLPWFEVPVFNWYEGHLTTIYSGQYIRSAQQNYPQARRLTELEHQALDEFDRLTNDPELSMQMEFRVGDMQFLHNHQILHSRTDFEDWEDASKKRHLYRLWLAPKGARPLPPSFAARYGQLTPGDRGGIIVKDTRLTFELEVA